MTSGIEVSRPKGKGFRRDMFRRYKILIDDVHVASLREGESHSVNLDPGKHRIQAKIDWTGTPVVEVSLHDEVVRFLARPGGDPSEALRQTLEAPKAYLLLERVEEQ